MNGTRYGQTEEMRAVYLVCSGKKIEIFHEIERVFLAQKTKVFRVNCGVWDKRGRKKYLLFMSTGFILERLVEQNGVKSLKKALKWGEVRSGDRHI